MFEQLDNKCFIIFDDLFIILIGVLHLVSSLLIGKTNLEDINIYSSIDSFYSSPFFDFTLSNTTCYKFDRKHTFHEWGGIKETRSYYNYKDELVSYTSISDETNIDKIYGYRFCYNRKNYIDLLLNDQIIKKGEKCGSKYPKDCGIIDTLEQHLCIENNDNCPLYDIGILGKNESINKEHYIYNK